MFSSGCALSGFWLRMVSSAIAVLPVWRSPMISSRWPRPIGVSASIALRPVAIGSPTGMRAAVRAAGPGAGGRGLGRGLAGEEARRLAVHALALGRLDRTLAVDGIAERVDDASEQA